MNRVRKIIKWQEEHEIVIDENFCAGVCARWEKYVDTFDEEIDEASLFLVALKDALEVRDIDIEELPNEVILAISEVVTTWYDELE